MLVKDWCESKQYEYLGAKTKGPQWAWEFLRRNTEYQSAWKRLCGIPIYNGQATSDNDPIEWYETYYPSLPGETVKTFIQRFQKEILALGGAIHPPFMSLDVLVARRFRLNADPVRTYMPTGRPVIPSPLEDNPWQFEGFSFADGGITLLGAGIPPECEVFLGTLGHNSQWDEKSKKYISIPLPENEVVWRADNPEQVAVIFDLKWPIRDQCRLVEHGLKHQQEEMVRARQGKPVGFRLSRRNKIHRATYIRYLRLLDAQLDGVSIADSATVIYPKASDTPGESVRDRARKALAAAKRLSETDYPLLLFG